MGGVYKIWKILHRNTLFTITNDFDFMLLSFKKQSELGRILKIYSGLNHRYFL